MKADVHEHLSEMLARYGVTHLFGMRVYPLDLERVQQIVIHHEASAALMAYGYARVSGRVGVMSLNKAATPNAIMGLAEAWTSSVPVIVLLDGVPVVLEGRNSQFAQDQVGMMRPVTKWIGDVPEMSMAPEVLAKAFRVSTTGRPRPVMVNLRGAGPTTVNPAFSFDAEPRCEPQYGVFPAQRLGPDPAAIESAAALLSNAERPCIIAGGGVVLSRAWDALLSLAEAGRIPVATTLSGKGSFPERHELSAGPTGGFGGMGGPLGRARIARKIVNDSDVVLLVGTRTNEMATNRWTVPDPGATIIHMDVDPEEPGRNYDTAVAIVSDAKLGLEALSKSLRARTAAGPASRQARVDEIRQLMDQWHADIRSITESDAVPIHAARVVHEVERFVDKNTILVSDGSQLVRVRHEQHPGGRRHDVHIAEGHGRHRHGSAHGYRRETGCAGQAGDLLRGRRRPAVRDPERTGNGGTVQRCPDCGGVQQRRSQRAGAAGGRLRRFPARAQLRGDRQGAGV